MLRYILHLSIVRGGLKSMKKKILSFVLAICLIIPTILFVGCTNNTNNSVTYSVNITTNLDSHCSIYGKGNYHNGETVTIAVVPDSGYEFVRWSDGVTSSVREEQIYSDKTYTAEIKAVTTAYALDKVELYIEQYGTMVAKSVFFNSLEIISNNNVITECNLRGAYISEDAGAKMVEFNSLEGVVIKASKKTPFIMYSAKNVENKFIENIAKSVEINGNFTCSDGSSSHGGLLANIDRSLVVNSSSLKQTITLYTDSQHGYKIMATLNFVEI